MNQTPFQTMDTEGFSRSLELDLGPVELIQLNPYCGILRSTHQSQPVILKQYRPEHRALATEEATALRSWADHVSHHPSILPTDCIALNELQGTLAIQYVTGRRLTDAIRDYQHSSPQQQQLIGACQTLGRAQAHWRPTTLAPPSTSFASHYGDYFRYLERRLTGLGGVLGRLFRSLEGQSDPWVENLLGSGDGPSRTHGDFVPRNIHYDEGRIGVIDLANSLALGHPYDDLWNFRFALEAMPLRHRWRSAIVEGMESPLRAMNLSPAADRFFHEYHRRRWLMLRFTSRSPKAWLDAARGLMTFARARA